MKHQVWFVAEILGKRHLEGERLVRFKRKKQRKKEGWIEETSRLRIWSAKQPGPPSIVLHGHAWFKNQESTRHKTVAMEHSQAQKLLSFLERGCEE